MLVGACVIIACAWVAMPKFTVREVVVDHVVTRDVAINNLIPHDIPIEIPHIVATTPAPTTPEDARSLRRQAGRALSCAAGSSAPRAMGS